MRSISIPGAMVVALLGLMTVGWFGCSELPATSKILSSQTAQQTFSFQMSESHEFQINLEKDQQPLAGAIVSVFEGSDRETSSLLFQGVSDADGHTSGLLVTPRLTTQLSVLVTSPGNRGAYTDESLRRQLGPVAPAVWLVIAKEQLATLQLSFERNLP